MRLETIIAIYTIIKAFFLGVCIHATYGWSLFLTLPAGLLVSFLPIVSEVAAIYYGAKALGLNYLAMALIVLVPSIPLFLLFLKLTFTDFISKLINKARGWPRLRTY